MFTMDALVLFSHTSIGLAPAAKVLKDTRLPLVVHLPEATIGAMMGVKPFFFGSLASLTFLGSLGSLGGFLA